MGHFKQKKLVDVSNLSMIDLPHGQNLSDDLQLKPVVGAEMKHHIVFETYGVNVRISSNEPALVEKIRESAKVAFLDRLEFFEDSEVVPDYTFGIYNNGTTLELHENGSFRSDTESEYVMLKFFISLMRVTIAERAKDRVFVHSGVVGRNGAAILIPGNSYSGKTTLVAELIGHGFEYFSDEYAVLDEKGFVHPFPRPLSIRVPGDREIEREISPESIGASVAVRSAPVGMVLITEFSEGESFAAETLTKGNGIKELIPHSIPVRYNTDFTLKVLNNTVSRAIILKGPRGEASKFAEFLSSYIDNIRDWPHTASN